MAIIYFEKKEVMMIRLFLVVGIQRLLKMPSTGGGLYTVNKMWEALEANKISHSSSCAEQAVLDLLSEVLYLMKEHYKQNPSSTDDIAFVLKQQVNRIAGSIESIVI